MPDPEGERVIVYTDGSCLGNPGRGGWAWATSKECWGSGSSDATTNNRMEIKAVVEALRAHPDQTVLVVSDSRYVVDCMRNGWHKRWAANGWCTSNRKPVQNQDLWGLLLAEFNARPVSFQWVRGHNGDVMNTFVDHLAGRAARMS